MDTIASYKVFGYLARWEHYFQRMRFVIGEAVVVEPCRLAVLGLGEYKSTLLLVSADQLVGFEIFGFNPGSAIDSEAQILPLAAIGYTEGFRVKPVGEIG